MELLLRGDTLEDWWEEELLIVGQFESWLVAVTHKIDLLDVGWVVIVDALSLEVELTRLSWVELEADDAEALSVDEADGGEGFEGLGGILEDLVVDGGVAGVRDLDRLVDRLVRAARSEGDLAVAHFDHWDKGLRAGWERMA